MLAEEQDSDTTTIPIVRPDGRRLVHLASLSKQLTQEVRYPLEGSPISIEGEARIRTFDARRKGLVPELLWCNGSPWPQAKSHAKA